VTRTRSTGQDTVARFDDRAGDYVRYRPGYPSAAIDAILEGLGEPSRLIAADVGAGTGISARLLADRGVDVIAVEPGERMRTAADAHPRVRWVAGRADATGLRSASVNQVLCAQAFHWFQTIAAARELGRILRSGGRLAIMWNRRSRTDPFTAGYRQAIADVGGESAHETAPFDRAVIDSTGLFSPLERLAFPNAQRLDFDGLLGRARSASYVPKTGKAGERLVALLRDLHARHADTNGIVTLVYETELFRAARLSS
jgi:SAM-dependent methyltransferase